MKRIVLLSGASRGTVVKNINFLCFVLAARQKPPQFQDRGGFIFGIGIGRGETL